MGSVSGSVVSWLTEQYMTREKMSGDDFEVLLDKYLGRPVDQEAVLVASAMANGMSASAGTLQLAPQEEQDRFAGTPVYVVGTAEPVAYLPGNEATSKATGTENTSVHGAQA